MYCQWCEEGILLPLCTSPEKNSKPSLPAHSLSTGYLNFINKQRGQPRYYDWGGSQCYLAR